MMKSAFSKKNNMADPPSGSSYIHMLNMGQVQPNFHYYVYGSDRMNLT